MDHPLLRSEKQTKFQTDQYADMYSLLPGSHLVVLKPGSV